MISHGKVGNSQHFPTNLHILLDESAKANHSHIVSWCPQGNSFKIHDQEALVPLLARYFRQTKFKSFLRQLQSYGFRRTTRGSDKGTVSHPLFVRGRRSLCLRMSRKPTGRIASEKISRIPRLITPPENLMSHSKVVQTDFLPLQMKNETFSPRINLEENAAYGCLANNSASDLTYGRSPFAKIVYSQMNEDENNETAKRNANHRSTTIHDEGSTYKCTEIDYRLDSSYANAPAPQDSFVLSIKESSSAGCKTKCVPFHKQDLFLPQDLRSMKQVGIQQLQYHQGQVPQQQVNIQCQAQPVNPEYLHQQEIAQLKPCQLEVQPIQVQQKGQHIHPRVEKLYSHQEVVEQIKLAAKEVAKHYERKRQDKLKYQQQLKKSLRQPPFIPHNYTQENPCRQMFDTAFSTKYNDQPKVADVNAFQSAAFDISFDTNEFTETVSDSDRTALLPQTSFILPDHQGLQTGEAIISPQEEHQQQRAERSASVDIIDTFGNLFDEGDMKCTLQDEVEGYDEREMKAVDFVEGLNYYGFLNTEEEIDSAP